MDIGVGHVKWVTTENVWASHIGSAFWQHVLSHVFPFLCFVKRPGNNMELKDQILEMLQLQFVVVVVLVFKLPMN